MHGKTCEGKNFEEGKLERGKERTNGAECKYENEVGERGKERDEEKRRGKERKRKEKKGKEGKKKEKKGKVFSGKISLHAHKKGPYFHSTSYNSPRRV